MFELWANFNGHWTFFASSVNRHDLDLFGQKNFDDGEYDIIEREDLVRMN